MRPLINKEQIINYELDIAEESEWISVSPCEMARGAFFYMQEAGHFYCGPKYFTEREGLQSYLIKYTIAGTGVIEYRGKRLEAKPGSIFFLKCDEHQYYATSGSSWEIIWIHFNGASSREYFDRFYEACGSYVVQLPHPEEVREAMEKILSIYRLGGIYADILASKLVVDVLTQAMIAATGVNENAAHLPQSVRSAIDIIQSKFREQITLDSLSEEVAINKYYLQKLFKKHTGVSPNSFLISTRINRAKELLRFSDMRIDEIATSVGVENTSHFIKTFKTVTSMTPNTYRKMWRAMTNGQMSFQQISK